MLELLARVAVDCCSLLVILVEAAEVTAEAVEAIRASRALGSSCKEESKSISHKIEYNTWLEIHGKVSFRPLKTLCDVS